MSYGLSFWMHVIILALFAIPVYQTIQEESHGFTTILANVPSDGIYISGSIDTEIDLPAGDVGNPNPLENSLLDPGFAETLSVPTLSSSLTSPTLGGGTGEKGEGGGGGAGLSHIRIAEPSNAIRAGSFSVWPWPIRTKLLGGDIEHGEPGSSPRVFQDYHIVIRIKVPGNQKSVSVSDFSGEVVGTDLYQQKIPIDSFFYNTQGRLVSTRGRNRIPVINGTAELLVLVPGAGQPRVRDKITVHSKLLNETQEVELVFLARDDRRRDRSMGADDDAAFQ